MIDLHRAVVDLLAADSTLATLLPGGVWNRELRQTGPGATPAAWGPIDPGDPLSPTVLRPSMVVRDAGEFSSGFPFGGNAKAMLFLYVPASDAGRTLITLVDARLRSLVDRQPMAVASGDGVPRYGEGRLSFRTRVLDETAYGGVMFTSWTLTLMTARLTLAY